METTPQHETDRAQPASRDADNPAAGALRRHEMTGAATVRRVGRWRYPVFELTQDGTVLATLGRAGWLRIFFGRGQQVELADGSRWRIKAVGHLGKICPAIFDSQRRRIAVSSLGVGGYGVNGRDYGWVLFRADRPRFGRANRWILRQHDQELAVVTRTPPSIKADHSVHLGGVLLSFTLAHYGVLGEDAPRFKLSWGQT